jgi:hypothetical protein
MDKELLKRVQASIAKEQSSLKFNNKRRADFKKARAKKQCLKP